MHADKLYLLNNELVVHICSQQGQEEFIHVLSNVYMPFVPSFRYHFQRINGIPRQFQFQAKNNNQAAQRIQKKM